MLEISTIQDFEQLPLNLQGEVQKAIRTKDRLYMYLRDLNKRPGQEKPEQEPHWDPCKCVQFGAPGWFWVTPHKRDDSDIHPSQINKCLKFLWHSCNGDVGQMEEFIEPKLRMIFDIGHAWHDTIQRYGKRGAFSAPEFYRCEVPFDPDQETSPGIPTFPVAKEFWLRGSADAIIDRYELRAVPGLGDVNIRVLHEYKTINSSGFTKLTRPKPEHKWQATIYSAVFNVPIVVYLYTNKDNCDITDYPVAFDHSIWSEVMKKARRVQELINVGQAPAWEETSAILKPSECMSCGFRRVCNPPVAQIAGRKST